jgi:hypothetical protein
MQRLVPLSRCGPTELYFEMRVCAGLICSIPKTPSWSVAHYLVLHGWDNSVDHQKRAVYAYYGGHYETDRDKYYMKAVLAYSDAVHTYLADHPVGPGVGFMPDLLSVSMTSELAAQ